MVINKDHLLEEVDVSISKSWKLLSLIIYENTICGSDSLALLTTKPEIRPLGNNVDEDIDTIYTSTPTRVHIIRPITRHACIHQLNYQMSSLLGLCSVTRRTTYIDSLSHTKQIRVLVQCINSPLGLFDCSLMCATINIKWSRSKHVWSDPTSNRCMDGYKYSYSTTNSPSPSETPSWMDIDRRFDATSALALTRAAPIIWRAHINGDGTVAS